MNNANTHAFPQKRADLYAWIHKGLRAFMGDTLARVGRLDTDDEAELAQTLEQVRGLLACMDGHLRHENEFVHSAMESRRPGTSRRIAKEHEHHAQAIAVLGAAAAALETAGESGRGAAAADLYRALGLFLAENLEHMNVEETEHNAVLWSAFSDAELAEIEQRIVAAIPPEQMMVYLRWMIPAMAPAERAEMLSGMQRGAPAEAFHAVLAMLRTTLGDRDWYKLMAAIRPMPMAA